MNKHEFLHSLREKLNGFTEADINDYLEYYSEMIDDRVEEGLTEEEAVADIGTPEDIASRIISEASFSKLIKAKLTPKHKLKAWEIVLLALGSPVWLSLAIAAFAVLVSLIVSVVAMVISLYAVTIALCASLLGGIAGCISNSILGNPRLGFVLLSCGLCAGGMGILMFIGMVKLTKLLFSLCKKLTIQIKSRLIRKEEAV